MKLSLALSGLFSTPFLWCKGLSLNVEVRRNEENTLKHQIDADSYLLHLEDSALENDMTQYDDISTVQKSRSLQQTMIRYWVQRGNTVSPVGFDSHPVGTSVCLNKRGTRLVVGVPGYNPDQENPSIRDGKIEIYHFVNSQWDLVQTIVGASGTIEGSKGISVSITPKGDHIAVLNGGDSIATENGGYNIAGAGYFSVHRCTFTEGCYLG